MNTQDVIDSYVTEVVVHLPRNQRTDVAAELRSLLRDELSNGDETAALALVRRFGRPAEAAARYHAPYTIVDAADTRSFIIAAVFGALAIPSTNPRLPISVDKNTALLLFLGWLGALVLFFAAKSWAVHRWPEHFQWNPSPPRNRDRTHPLEQLGVIIVFVVLGTLYLAPGAILGVLSAGGIAADRFAHTTDFAQPLREWGFAICLAVLIILHGYAGIARRWTGTLRVLSICFLICAGVQLGWHASYGRIFRDPMVDGAGRLVFQLIGGTMLLFGAIEIYREWTRPLPQAKPAAA